MPQLRLALAQINPAVGDLAGNAAMIAAAVREAADLGAHLVVLPEMALTGYPLEDLALRASLIEASRTAITQLAATLLDDGLGEVVAVVGYLDGDVGSQPRSGAPKNQPRNAVAVLHGGQTVARQFKHHLWNYGVGDEMRNFVPGDTLNVIQVHGIDVAIAICEDLWQDGPSAAADAAEAALLVVPNGSPYERNKDDLRLELCARRAREGACALAYVNLVGGQDELVFDGDSLVVDANGDLVARAAQFSPEVLVVDLQLPPATAPMPDPDARFFGLRVERTVISSDPVASYETAAIHSAVRLDDLAEIYTALVVGLRDYVAKNGFGTVLMGLSGGIDSTLVGAIAVDALGASNVFGVSNPSVWSSDHSMSDAAELARRTGLQFDIVAIAPMVDAFHQAVKIDGLAAENLQARVRAVVWMALSNQHGHLVLACGNKSELATGYSTIYGDAVGGYAPIKDVPKTLVWQLAAWRNAEALRRGDQPPIPEGVITKPPSAELRPGQLDSDSLPPYELLDAVLDAYVERDLGSAQLLAEGFDADLVARVIALVDKAEYKRRQFPTGPKISRRNFGRDRRVPITHRWREPPPR
ncbi:MAG: NAD+ synthase [Nocardioidaceae bacterium]|nr:NAD+ synthase [Nocardioidaceae bacterium]